MLPGAVASGVVSARLNPSALSGFPSPHASFMSTSGASPDVCVSSIRSTIVGYLDRLGNAGVISECGADGTQWDLYENNLLSERHIRYGGYGGIAYYHVSDNYIALFSHFIPCGVWEAIYILDGLTKNQSDIQPDTLHGDTQAQSTPVFGLAYLLGSCQETMEWTHPL